MLPCLDVIIINDISTAIFNRSLCTNAHTTKDIYTFTSCRNRHFITKSLGSFFEQIHILNTNKLSDDNGIF